MNGFQVICILQRKTNLLKKLKKNRQQDREIYSKIAPWHDGVVVSKDGLETDYIYFTMAGDSLYRRTEFKLEYIVFTAINYEECIQLAYNKSEPIMKAKFSRYNLKKEKIIWNNQDSPLADLAEKARIDHVNINKNGNMWLYNIHITLYNGIKSIRRISLNIDSGKYTLEK